jgi:RHS repeat-associated protein
VTRAAGKGAGNAVKKARGQLPAYQRYRQKFTGGRADAHGGKGVFSPRTSRLVGSKSSATVSWFRNADGSVTRRVYQVPVNYQVSKGVWAPIDTRLVAVPGGRLRERANFLPVSFASVSGTSDLASVQLASGESVGWTVAGGAKVTARGSGSVASYQGILPRVTIREAAGPAGVKETIVLGSAAAGNVFAFRLDVHGLTPSLTSSGRIVFKTAAGKQAGEIPLAFAADSKVNPHTGLPATTQRVSYRLTTDATGGWLLTVTLDRAWLESRARVFPVTIDPTFNDTIAGTTGTTFTYAGAAGDYSSYNYMDAGECPAASCTSGADAVSLISFAGGSVPIDGQGYNVTSALLVMWDIYTAATAADCAAGTNPSTIDVSQITQGWSVTGVKTYPGPSYGSAIGSAAISTPNACANNSLYTNVGDWVAVPLSASAINAWTYGTQPDYGLAVYGATGALTWRIYGSDNLAGYEPYLQITYSDQAPQINNQWPPNGYAAQTLTPELIAGASTPAGSTATQALQYDFMVYNSAGTKVADSGLVASGDWSVPAGDLTWSQTYYWTVDAYDGQVYSPQPPWQALSTVVPQPLISSTLSQNPSGNGYDPASGNYTMESTDASVASVGPSLDVVRSYNSLNWRTTGAFGSGWSSVFDVRASEQYSAAGALASVTVTYPDGSQVGFGKNADGTFSQASGRFATMATVSGGGYTLTDKNDTVYTFTHLIGTTSGASAYGITSVADAAGRTVTFTWSANEITTMTSGTSGRALHLTWATPSGAGAAHVATVSTDAVISGQAALTWTYTYSGDELATVCPPTSSSACTKYSYSTGSQFQTAALDAGPQSLWSLTETSGTVAHSAVLANEGTDNATYANVTLGAAGPLAGSSATAASFNGSTSHVALPPSLVAGASFESMSMWFKTTSANEVLFSYSKDAITASSTTGNYTPSMYIGSDGKLISEYWYSAGISPVETSAAVNDGKWHEVVLSAGGNTQSLYLDGALVGTKSGTVSTGGGISTGIQPNDYLGGGFLGGGWPDETKTDGTTNTGYSAPFNGSIAEAAFYVRPLVPSDVTGLYQAGITAAALLSTITRPSGKTYSTVAYNAVTARVTSVTNADGGNWAVSAPAVSGSSQVYRAAVLGSDPSGYYRLADQAGATNAYDEVKYGTATYNGGVTLGAPGSAPFADTTGATFDGSSGYLQLPSTDAITTGPNTVELWFKMTAGDINGGVLFEEEQCALSADPVSCGGYNPVLYVGTDGRLHGQFWINNISAVISSPGVVNDGKWHSVVLAASTSAQNMYLDGALVGTQSGTLSATGVGYVYVGAGASGGSWPFHPANSLGYFSGSISDLAFYRSELSAQDVTAHYAAYMAGASGLAPTKTVQVTDPAGKTETYTYDPMQSDRELSATDGLGNKTSYNYDSAGFLSTVVDPDGGVTVTGHDVRGNVVSESSCQNQATGACSTAYYTYYPDDTTAKLTPNASNDVLLTARGDGSSSPSDNTYLTSYTYDKWGDRTSDTSPPVPGFPNGRTTSTVYTDGTSAFPATGGGNAPPGLIASVTDPSGAVTTYTYYSGGDLATLTTPLGETTTYTYDNLGRALAEKVVSDTFPSGLTTSYVYDGLGEVTQETSPSTTNRITGAVHQAVTTTSYDADGNVLSQTVSDATTGGDASRTMSSTYNAYDKVATATDAVGGVTTYSYDGYGNKISETDPNGITTSYAYDPNGHQLSTTVQGYTGSPPGSQTAANLVTDSRTYDPSGRLANETDAMGYATSFTYTDNGLPVTETRTSTVSGNSGSYVLQNNTYNAAGQLTQQVTGNGSLTTAYSVDAAGRVASQTVDPSGVNRTTSYTFDPSDRVLTRTVASSAGSDSTARTYDAQGNATSTTTYGASAGRPVADWPLNAEGGTVAADVSGNGNTGTTSNVTWSGGAATFGTADTSQVTTSAPVLNTAGSFTVSAWANLSATGNWGTLFAQGIGTGGTTGGVWLGYDPSTQCWSLETSNAAATTYYSASSAANTVTTGAWAFVVGSYDASTGNLSLFVNGSLAAQTAWPSPFSSTGASSVGEAQGIDHFHGQIGNVQAYSRTLSVTEIATLYAAGRTSTAVAGTGQVTTTATYDTRGLPASSTDGNGNTATYAYDEAGQLTQTVEPAVSTTVYSASSGAPVTATAHPVTSIGYNTFGEKAEEQNPNGNVTSYAYDADGQLASQTDPSYIPPGSLTVITPVTSFQYDGTGQKVKETDPMGNVTTYGYDQLGDQTSVKTPDANTTTYAYDTNGDLLSTTKPTGAVTTATYDYMQRQLTSTQVERYPSAQSLTSSNSYDSSGNLASDTSPAGVVTSYGHNAAGEQTSVTDEVGNTTSYGYDQEGRRVKTTNPDGTYSTVGYDSHGNMTGTADYNASGTQLRSTSATYDGNGAMLSATDALGYTKRYSYDATGVLTSETQPVTSSSAVAVSYAYDPAGQQTAYTDPNGHATYATYNTLGLPESVIEPAAGSYTSAANSTSTSVYNARGELVTQNLPGGVQVTNAFNAMGDLTGQSGSGATAATATRSFGYDANGRLTSAATAAAGTSGSAGYQPATSEAFTYNDRGQVLTAAGSAGSSSSGYNGDGQLSSRTDASGTSSYTYDKAGRLSTQADAASGTTATYSYNTMDQVSSVSYGSGNDIQSFGYDALHRLTTDAVTTSAGAAVASVGYGYNANDWVTSMNTSGLAVSGGGTGTASNTYGYDQAGRLASWTSGSTAHTYGYDSNGNLTSSNGTAYTYDARNQLTSDGTRTYTYSANGDVTSATSASATVSSTSDAYQQQVTAGSSSYTYDALDRLLSVAGSATMSLSYSGMTDLLAADSSATYSRDPSGTVTGVTTAGGGKTIALSNQHMDLTGLIAPAGTSVTGSVTFDPWGKPLGTSGTQVQVGFQGGWTDPATGQVLMGARFYNPATSGFLNQDQITTSAQQDPAAGGDLHAYVDDNPVTGTDLTGHCWVVCSIVSSAVHTVTHVAKAAVHAVTHVAKAVVHTAARVVARTVAVVRTAVRTVRHVASVAVAHVVDAYHTAVHYAVRAVQAVAHYAVRAARAVVHVVRTAYHKVAAAAAKVAHAVTRAARAVATAVVKTVKATASFVKKHAATIASIAAGVAVFAGCTALTAGAGAIACGALAGVVSSAITQGAACASGQKGACSVASFAKAVVIGGVTGALGGALGGGAASDLAGTALGDTTATSAADAAATAGADTAATAGADTSGSVVADTAAAAGERPPLAALKNEGTPSCGGLSFSAGTGVLLATGKIVAISKLKAGQKVLATNTATGKNQPGTVAAVLLHHDTDLYDLNVRAGRATEVIATTSSHLFWEPGSHGHHGRWIKAAALIHGTHLRTPHGTTATVTGGWTPRHHDGWMWDLTITTDHDFYVLGEIPVLVHNCGINDPSSEISQVSMAARMEHGVSPSRNIAVYRVGEGENAHYLAAGNNPGGLHSEEILNNYVNNAGNGISPRDVTGVYSERLPCVSDPHNCAASLTQYPNAQADISWSLSAGARSAAAIARSMGEYGGPRAGLPRATWITG